MNEVSYILIPEFKTPLKKKEGSLYFI